MSKFIRLRMAKKRQLNNDTPSDGSSTGGQFFIFGRECRFRALQRPALLLTGSGQVSDRQKNKAS